MNHIKPLRFIFGAILAVGFSTGAFAQATRTWVSGVGDDVNPCSRTAPCKTFAGAISKTAEGGEIDALDPAGYGTLTITKAMTVDGGTGSGWASVLNTGGISGFTINITTGTHVNDAVIILRNITINGASQSPSVAGTNGISYIKGNRVYVEYCRFENQSTSGINGNMASAGALFVRDCDFDNTNAGIKATTTVGPLFVDANNINVHGQTDGVNFISNASGTITKSFFTRIITGNAISAGNACVVNVTQCSFRSNSNAINALAGSTVRVSENEIFDNTNGLAGVAASFQSGVNNKLAGNGASVAPTGAPITTQ
ncbi:MAG: hypothetical protein QOF24_200 [Verrucomicrobiota bacterium]